MRRLQIIPFLVGLIAAAIGMEVIAGYRGASLSFISFPRFPMQFNSALCFVIAGVATALGAVKQSRWLAVLGGAISIIGGLSLAEHTFRIDLGIDQLFHVSANPLDELHPGRIWPNTALIFIFVGIILCVRNLTEPSVWRTTLMALLSLSVVGVALVTVTARWSQATTPIFGGWQMTRMIPNTALLYLALGLNFLLIAYIEKPRDMKVSFRPLDGPIASLFVIACVLFLWFTLTRREHYRLVELNQVAATAASAHFQAKFDAAFDSLTRLGHRWELESEKAGGSIWADDGRRFLSHHPHVDSLFVTDAAGKFRWGVAATNARALDRPAARSAFQEAAQLKPEKRRVVLSSLEKTIDQDHAMLALMPVFLDGRFDGALIVEIHPHLLFSATLDQLKFNQSFSLYYGGNAVYHRAKETTRVAANLRQRHSFLLGADPWEMEISPDRETLLREETPFASLTLAGGLTIAILVGMLVLLAQSARKRAEEANDALRRLEEEVAIRQATDARLRDSLDRLKASQEQYFELAEAMPQIVWTASADGKVDYLNRRWHEYVGLSAADLDADPTAALHPDDAIHFLESWKASTKAGSDWEMEFRLRRGADQVFRWHLGRAVAARDSTGKVTRWLGTSTDIHDQKVIEDELRRLMETLELRVAERTTAAEQANTSKSEFLANMSHEIRTPMTAILGFADILLDESAATNASPQHVENLNTIKRNALHLLDIINGILDLSKIESGKLELERINVSPRKLAEDAHALMAVRAQAKGLPFRLDIREPIPAAISADPTRVRQILINLLGNAIKFTETGSVELRLCVDSPPDQPAMLRFEVVDTGIGMNEEEASRVFQPFSQADASMTRRFGGTGLGLSISRRLAQMMGGEVVFHSRAGVGSTFVLTIPIAAAQVDEAVVAEAPKRTADSVRFADLISLKCRILLAEDGPDNQRLISFHLRKIASELVVAENGRVAVELAMAAWRTGRPYDVILMDMQMPELDGYGATAQLREFGYPGPIIALTAHAMAGDRQRCLEAGCDDYATKPIDREVLLNQIAELLGRPISQPAV